MKVVRAFTLSTLLAIASSAAVAPFMLTACSRKEQAPAITYTLLDGRKSDLASLRGRVVLVNFWATDCAPCVAEMPQLAETWRKLSPAGFDTLAVSMANDPPFAVSNFAQSHHLPFGVAIDNTGEIEARFGGVRYTPTSILIDKQGRITARWIGATDIPQLEKQIEALLKAG